MMLRNLYFGPMVALLAAFIPHLASSQEVTARIGALDYAKITDLLSQVEQLIGTGKVLVQNERTLKQGQDMMAQAEAVFGETKNLIIQSTLSQVDQKEGKRKLLRQKYADHDLKKTEEDEMRALDVARQLKHFEMVEGDGFVTNAEDSQITFPGCVHLKLDHCERWIKRTLRHLDLPTPSFKVNKKRDENDPESYNRVVIVTDAPCESVTGQAGDGVVTYPYKWKGDGSPRDIGPWDCSSETPEGCCAIITDDVTDQDNQGNYIECNFQVPVSLEAGADNPAELNTVYLNESIDPNAPLENGKPVVRVEETPYVFSNAV